MNPLTVFPLAHVPFVISTFKTLAPLEIIVPCLAAELYVAELSTLSPVENPSESATGISYTSSIGFAAG